MLTFLGALGVAAAAQNALNTVWGVPFSRRAGFPWSMLKQIGLILAVGIGLLATTLLSGLAGASASVLGGTAAKIGTVVVSLVLNILVFWLGFRLAVQREIKARQMLPGAALSAIVWQILQLFGTAWFPTRCPRARRSMACSAWSSACWPGSTCRPSSPSTRWRRTW